MAVQIGNVWNVAAWADGVWAAGVWAGDNPGGGGGGSGTTLTVVSRSLAEPADANLGQASLGVVHATVVRR